MSTSLVIPHTEYIEVSICYGETWILYFGQTKSKCEDG